MISPGKIYRKVARVAAFDGWSLVIFGGLSLLFGAIWLDRTGLMIGVGLFTLGWIELHGRKLWLERKPRAAGWLAGSQIGVLCLLVSYAARCYFHPPIWTLNGLPPEMQNTLQALPNFDPDLINEMLPTMLKISYLALILVVLMYQGGMALYYLRAQRQLGECPPPL